jgi:hypothetical protein
VRKPVGRGPRRTFYKIALLLTCAMSLTCNGAAEELTDHGEHQKFPVIVGLQFQNFAMPLRDSGSNFSHPGLFGGTELAYNRNGTFLQNLIAGGYLNRQIGNGMHISSQLGFRPRIVKDFFGEMKLGVGYLRIFHPFPAYEYVEGEWQRVRGGKSQVLFPMDLGFGYSFSTSVGRLSPSISYQVSPALFYNSTLPLNIYTNFLLSLRVDLPK